jgi:hypothetical protein
VWHGNTLVAAGQAELWTFVHTVGQPIMKGVYAPDAELLRRLSAAELFVVEDWVLYADKAEKLIGDRQETVRGIGALQFIARARGIDFVFQPATIKDGACEAGAREFFTRPLYPNRHSNDATMHGVYYAAMQGKGVVSEV